MVQSKHDIAVHVESLSKSYRIDAGKRKASSWADAVTGALKAPWRRFSELSGRGNESETFWALRDVSFEVKRGEVIGVIGRNGAGKSTLLKILSQITSPTSGRAVFQGRLGSLLEVGTGFHKELTGRENIYLNGAILGMKKTEIDRLFDAIIDFAEIESFLDTPVKRYSSGMYVRLAFAVAAHLEPEILLVDEVLAVGDAAFQNKCLGKMNEVGRAGRTILFVSHNMSAVKRLCSQCIYLQDGQIVAQGPSGTVVDAYLKAAEGSDIDHAEQLFDANPASDMVIRRIQIIDDSGSARSTLDSAQPITIAIDYDVNKPVRSHRIGVSVFTSDGTCVLGTTDADCHVERMEQREPGQYRTHFTLPAHLLNEGRYVLNVGAGPYGGAFCDLHERAIAFTLHDTSTQRQAWMRHSRQGVLGLELPWNQELLMPARAISA